MEDNVTGVITPSGGGCGVVLSPWFPGLVEPGYWSWLVEGTDGFYFDVFVYYVHGPELAGGDCGQFFQSTCVCVSMDVCVCAYVWNESG